MSCRIKTKQLVFYTYLSIDEILELIGSEYFAIIVRSITVTNIYSNCIHFSEREVCLPVVALRN